MVEIEVRMTPQRRAAYEKCAVLAKVNSVNDELTSSGVR
jgi:hypothetical protein